MSTPHKATAEQWSQIEGYAATDMNDDYASCLLDLRARVEALEEAENDRRFEQAKEIIDKPTPATASSLVERVAATLRQVQTDSPWIPRWTPEARAAIREVAAWADQQGLQRTARKLREEVER